MDRPSLPRFAGAGHDLAAAGPGDEAHAVLAELDAMGRRRHVSPYAVAVVHTGLGDVDAAFTALDRACDAKAVDLVNVAAEPRFHPLRTDRRYAQLLGRIGLAPRRGNAIMHASPRRFRRTPLAERNRRHADATPRCFGLGHARRGLAGSTSAFAQDELAAVMRIESGDQPALEME